MRRPVALGLVVLAAGSWWLARPDARPPTRTVEGSPPGYAMTDATFEETAATGRPSLRVHAAQAVEEPAERRVTLSHVHADYRSAPRTGWWLDAESGQLPADGQTLMLSGDVVLKAADGTGASIRTAHLDLDRVHHLASTTDEVRIEWPPHVLVAHGLKADLSQRTLHLESPINGTFKR
jgi:LPS export ABC transporter protein LptC